MIDHELTNLPYGADGFMTSLVDVLVAGHAGFILK